MPAAPISRPDDDRKPAQAGIPVCGPVRIEDSNLARQLLRSDGIRQAELNCSSALLDEPMNWSSFRTARLTKSGAAPASFFAPKVVATRYRTLTQDLSAG
jgi:hypothetical protein